MGAETQRERVQTYCNAGMSIDEAKRTCRRHDLTEQVLAATTIDDLKEILLVLVKRT